MTSRGRGFDAAAYCFPPAEAVQVLYDGTPESSQARRLIVDLFADYGDHGWLSADAEFPREFLYDLSTQLFKQRKADGTVPATSACSISTYHEAKSVDKDDSKTAQKPLAG